jgi:hypothetical protein
MLTLTTVFPAVQFTRLIFTEFQPFDLQQLLTFKVQLWTGLAVNSMVCEVEMAISNTASVLLSRQGSPAAGLVVTDRDRYFIVSSRSTPTGYTDAMAAARTAANTPGARRTALETHVLSAGHIAADLTGGIT